MTYNPLGSSAVLVLAAVLWFVYLIPTWRRRREYLATERNAVRLQQTLRIMAETAQVPQQVHAETSARSVAANQRILKKEQQVQAAIAKAREAAALRAASRRLSAVRAGTQPSAGTPLSAADRLRRSRAITSLALLAGLVLVGVGIPAAFVGSVQLLVSGLIVAMAALALLRKMAAVAAARRELARQHMVAYPVRPRTQVAPAAGRIAPEHATWTPVPLPKPLYLSQPAPSVVKYAEPNALEAREKELREAAARAERALRLEQESPNVIPIVRPAAEASGISGKYAQMGLIGDLDGAVTDLDAVLRRRRVV